MGHIINRTVTYSDLDPGSDRPAYADVRIRGNLQLSLRTVEQIGWAILQSHSGLNDMLLRGMLAAPPNVFEIRPPWKRGWPEYVITYRADQPAPLDIEPLLKGNPAS